MAFVGSAVSISSGVSVNTKANVSSCPSSRAQFTEFVGLRRIASIDASPKSFSFESARTFSASPAPFFVISQGVELAAKPQEVEGSLAKKLKEGTAKSHNMAENVSFIRGFLNGLVEKASYRKLVANLYYVYSAIEEEMARNKEHPLIKPIYFEELNRKEALANDLKFYYGDKWESEAVCSPSAREYVARIHEIGKNDPGLLVAHAYTRYLGDLSGGQILKNIAKKAMNLRDGGLEFYEFRTIPAGNEGRFKTTYRQRMNNLPADDAYAQKIVDEANHAFFMNMNMFKELEGNYLKTMFQIMWNTVFPDRS